MAVIHDYDDIPIDQRSGYRLSGWIEKVLDGYTLRTNVRVKINGRNVPAWPELIGGVWSPSWVRVG